LIAPPSPRAARLVRIAHFLLVGGAGFVIDVGLVYLLSRAGLSPIMARIPAISAAILFTWLLNRRLTFRVTERPSRNELFRYASVALTSGILNFGLYSVLVLNGLMPLLAVALSTIALMAFSFFGYKIFAFQLKH